MTYMRNVWESLSTLAIGMKVTIGHMFKIRRGNVTLQYPVETHKVDKGEDILEAKHRGVTSHGTQKRLLVTRFDIDMTECCFCNLCVYPCPEECIFMVGGPNSSRREIDYEFSEYDRNDMVYRFSKVPEDVLQNYISESNEKVKEMEKTA